MAAANAVYADHSAGFHADDAGAADDALCPAGARAACAADATATDAPSVADGAHAAFPGDSDAASHGSRTACAPTEPASPLVPDEPDVGLACARGA